MRRHPFLSPFAPSGAMGLAFVGVTAVASALTVSSHYAQPTAIDYVWLSAAAYCSTDSIQNWNCGRPCEEISVVPSSVTVADNSEHNVQAFVAQRTNGDVIVSFRGTEPSSLKDWIDDLKYAKATPYPGCSNCHVHTGFYESYTALSGQIYSALNALGAGPGSTVHVAGHSLGAAMAAVAAYDLHRKGYNVGQSYTFGEPRVGDAAFAKSFTQDVGDSTIYRVVHWRDIVPHLPLELMGFHHIPTEVWYNENSSSYSVCNGSGEDSSCSDSLDIAISISDHLHYLDLPISGSCTVSSFASDNGQSVQPPSSNTEHRPSLLEPGAGLLRGYRSQQSEPTTVP